MPPDADRRVLLVIGISPAPRILHDIARLLKGSQKEGTIGGVERTVAGEESLLRPLLGGVSHDESEKESNKQDMLHSRHQVHSLIWPSQLSGLPLPVRH